MHFIDSNFKKGDCHHQVKLPASCKKGSPLAWVAISVWQVACSAWPVARGM